MNPGTVFYEGHQPLSTGVSSRYPPAVHLALRSYRGRHPAGRRARDLPRDRPRGNRRPCAADRPGERFLGRPRHGLRARPAGPRAAPGRASSCATRCTPTPSTTCRRRCSTSSGCPAASCPSRCWPPSPPGVPRSSAPLFRQRLLFYAILAAQLGVMTLSTCRPASAWCCCRRWSFSRWSGLRDLRGRGGRGLWLWACCWGVLALAFSVRDPAQNQDLYGRLAFSASLAMREQISATARRPAPASPRCGRRSARRPPRCRGGSRKPGRPTYPQDAESLEACVARRLRQQARRPRPAGSSPRSPSTWPGSSCCSAGSTPAEALLRPLAEEGLRFPREGAEPSSPRFLLARIAFLRGDRGGRPRASSKRASRRPPASPSCSADLGGAHRRAALRRAAAAVLQPAPTAPGSTGRALLFYRQPAAARVELAAVVARLPDGKTAAARAGDRARRARPRQPRRWAELRARLPGPGRALRPGQPPAAAARAARRPRHHRAPTGRGGHPPLPPRRLPPRRRAARPRPRRDRPRRPARPPAHVRPGPPAVRVPSYFFSS